MHRLPGLGAGAALPRAPGGALICRSRPSGKQACLSSHFDLLDANQERRRQPFFMPSWFLNAIAVSSDSAYHVWRILGGDKMCQTSCVLTLAKIYIL